MLRGLRHPLSTGVALVLSLQLTLTSGASFAQPTKASPAAPAQQPDLIAKGQTLFDDQQYEESVQTLSAALLRPNNTREQKVEIYRLLAYNYITIGRKAEADNAVRGLLVVRPDYELPESESPRFRDFFDETRAKWEAEGRPGLTAASERPVTLRHVSPPSAPHGKSIELHATLDDPNKRTSQVRLFYRSGSKGEFVEAEAEVEDEIVRAKIPASAAKPPLVDYYFEVLGPTGAVVTSRGDAQAPLRIAIPDKEGGGSWVVPLAVGGGILGAAAIVGGLALAGVFKGSSPPPASGGRSNSTVTVNVSEAGFHF
jgi:hypothetical protein